MAALVALLAHLFRSTLQRVFPRSRLGFLVHRTVYGLPSPRQPHRTLELEKGRSLVIVGDVHGCFDELEELLDICECDRQDVTTVFVGDLINKGPKSAEVVKRVRDLGAYSVRGNHDEVCLRKWQDYVEGKNPLPEKFQWMHKLSREEIDWLHNLPFTLTIPSLDILVVHAGLIPGDRPLPDQPNDAMLHMRDVSHRGNESGQYVWYKKSTEGSVPWAGEWRGPAHIYFGHDAIRKLQLYPMATGLDTGCVYGGKLTAVFPLEGGRIVQVDAHSVHRPTGINKEREPTTSL